MASSDFDFYKDDLSTPEDNDLFAAVEAFIRKTSPQAERMQEGYLLDFKQAWSDSALKTVAAFANTFGGLLLVGVSEKLGRADELVGIASQRQELKTGIASAIASNISPTPPYEIRVVAFPDGAGRNLCIVRVRKGNRLYLLTKRAEQSIYVRNEDQSIPADAARLQALLATRSTPANAAVEGAFPSVPPFVTNYLYVSQSQDAPTPAQRVRSTTFLRVRLIPEEMQLVRLDLTVEEELRLIILRAYPELSDNLASFNSHLGAALDDFRLRDWYQLTYRETLRDYEMGWGIDSTGSVYFVTQTRCKVREKDQELQVWSLADLITNVDCTIEAAHRFWSYLNYPGEAHIIAELQIDPLPLLERAGGFQVAYSSAFYERASSRKRAKVLTTDQMTRSLQHGTRATAAVDLTYSTRHGERPQAVAVLVNQLLRDLGYSSRLNDLCALFS